jgi:hypothetical protein
LWNPPHDVWRRRHPSIRGLGSRQILLCPAKGYLLILDSKAIRMRLCSTRIRNSNPPGAANQIVSRLFFNASLFPFLTNQIVRIAHYNVPSFLTCLIPIFRHPLCNSCVIFPGTCPLGQRTFVSKSIIRISPRDHSINNHAAGRKVTKPPRTGKHNGITSGRRVRRSHLA